MPGDFLIILAARGLAKKHPLRFHVAMEEKETMNKDMNESVFVWAVAPALRRQRVGPRNLKTVSFHYGKHHQAYVDNLNKQVTASVYWTMRSRNWSPRLVPLSWAHTLPFHSRRCAIRNTSMSGCKS